MQEPDWNNLPFPTQRHLWRCWLEVATAEEAIAFLRGEVIGTPSVWIECAAVEAFARTAPADVTAAFIAMGQGVCRWHRKGALADGRHLEEGQCISHVELGGGEGLVLALGKLGDCYLLHLPRSATAEQAL